MTSKEHFEPQEGSVESVDGGADAVEPEEDLLAQHPTLAAKLRRLLKQAKRLEEEPEILGDFRILHRIGSGGMATVYEAEQITLRRRVALKVLSPHLSLSERGVVKFRREAEAASRQSHPGVVTVYALGEEDGVWYIAAELVEGGRTLADLLEQQRREGETERGYFRRIARLIAEVAEALEHVHASGVIHRDVKPSNILITGDGRPRITDFGLARVEDAMAMSRTGDFLGTPYYMSPEQVMGGKHRVDHRTDVYALGVTLYECLTLERPFGGDTPQEVLHEIVVAEPHSPDGVGSRVPRDLRVICLKAIDKDPRHRYQSAAELAEDLHRFLAGEAILARPAGAVRKTVQWMRRRRPWVLGGAAVLLALGVAGGLGLELYRREQRDRAAAMAEYRPWREALGWPTAKDWRDAESWIEECTPGSPTADFVAGLIALESWDLDSAANRLNECIEGSGASKPGGLDLVADASYLLFLVELARAEAEPPRAEQARFLESAEQSLERAGSYDPSSRDNLILREFAFPDLPAHGMRRVHHDLQLNPEHALAHLFRGVCLFSRLFEGGGIGEFRDAIRSFETVLVDYPENRPALSFAARTTYFFARTYEFLSLLESARSYAERALSCPADEHYYLDHVTLGQIDLLVGEDEHAGKEFRAALVDAEGRKALAIHNAYRGLGQVHMRGGRPEEALPCYRKVLDLRPNDPHISVAMAEYHLSIGEAEQAYEYARSGSEHRASGEAKSSSLHSSVYLAMARAQLAMGKDAEALSSLEELQKVALEYPRFWSLACLFLPTWPEASIASDPRIAELARDLARSAGSNASFYDRASPACLAARGAALLLRGDPEGAARGFSAALEAREKWPEGIRANHWAEDARDRYYLAIAHAAAARESDPVDAGRLDLARRLHDAAEEACRERKAHPGVADLLQRVRAKAREVLEIPR